METGGKGFTIMEMTKLNYCMGYVSDNVTWLILNFLLLEM